MSDTNQTVTTAGTDPLLLWAEPENLDKYHDGWVAR